MAKKEMQALLELVENDHGFVLGEKLIVASGTVLKEFEDAWIEREKSFNKISRSMLEKSLTTTERVDSDVASFTKEWLLLQLQVGEPDSNAETADEWYFTLSIHKANRTFRFPYCHVAMSACNRIIQHYNKA